MDTSRAPHCSSVRTRVLRVAICATAVLGLTATSAHAMRVESAKATSTVERWASSKTFDEPYAFVDVKHEGRTLERTAVSRCKGQYVDKAITVQVSTCGSTWRVRAAYVSLSGRTERFRIVYSPRGNSKTFDRAG